MTDKLTMRKSVVVAGASSGAGKTRLAELMLGLLPGFAAVKITLTDAFSSVTDDESQIMVEGKDTWRLARAGARKVVWVRSTEQDMDESLARALELVGPEPAGVLFEGNYLLSRISPDLCLFVTHGGLDSLKPSRVLALGKADLVILNHRSPAPDPGLAAAVAERVAAVNPSALTVAMNLARPDMEILGSLARGFLHGP